MARKKKQPAQRTGVIYARYSSHNQKDASIEQQVEQCQKFAREQGISIIDIYADRAVSGKTDKRPAFQQMMKDAPNGRFNCVIAWKSNRIGRNMLQAMINEARLDELGVRCLYTEESFDDTAAGRFALRSMMNVNQFYSENMAEDVIRGMFNNAQRCKANGRLPFGYKSDAELNCVIDEDNAAVVREIFSRVACGDILADIARDLNARGLRTSSGAKWGRSSFQSILNNERYKGIYIYDSVRIEDGIPRIISDELFDKVQEVLRLRKSGKMRNNACGDFLLTGKLFCGECKSPMVGISGTSSTGRIHYYYSCNKHRLEKTCAKKNVKRDEIETAVATAICEHALRDDVLEWITDQTVAYFDKKKEDGTLSVLYDRLSETKKKIDNILSAIEQGIITATTKERLQALEAERAETEEQIRLIKSDIIEIDKDDMLMGLKMFKDGDITDAKFRAQLFDTFLVAVYVFDDHLKIVFSFSGDNNTVEIPTKALDALDSSNAVCKGSPMGSYANDTPRIYSLGSIFVLVYPISTTKKATL